eukprot:4887522-Pyramimonas_sp.AAC.1
MAPGHSGELEHDTWQGPLAQYVRAKGGSRVIRRLLVSCNGLAALKGLTSMRQWAAQVRIYKSTLTMYLINI